MRSWAGKSELERQARLERKTGVHPNVIRKSIEELPASDRVTEWLGSILVASLACVVLCLFGLAVWQSIGTANVEGWAFYTWLTFSCVSACTGILSTAKFLETQTDGDDLQRRMVLVGIGSLTGLISIIVANVFLVDLTCANFDRPDLLSSFGIPLPAFLAWPIFFVALFGVIGWWRVADPIRKSRLRLREVGISLVWATVLSLLLCLPLVNCCILAGVVSVSVQLASPWLSHARREQFCLGVQESKVA